VLICSVEGYENNVSCKKYLFLAFTNTKGTAEKINFTEKKGWTPTKNSKIYLDLPPITAFIKEEPFPHSRNCQARAKRDKKEPQSTVFT
jgi:hypothetical protein